MQEEEEEEEEEAFQWFDQQQQQQQQHPSACMLNRVNLDGLCLGNGMLLTRSVFLSVLTFAWLTEVSSLWCEDDRPVPNSIIPHSSWKVIFSRRCSRCTSSRFCVTVAPASASQWTRVPGNLLIAVQIGPPPPSPGRCSFWWLCVCVTIESLQFWRLYCECITDRLETHVIPRSRQPQCRANPIEQDRALLVIRKKRIATFNLLSSHKS